MSSSLPEGEKVEVIRHEVAFQGYSRVSRYFFRHTLFQGGLSEVISREVFERGQAAAILPYDPRRDEVVLIRQFRAGAYVAGKHAWLWEIAAGMIEEGEDAEEMVRREVVEETGLAVTDATRICGIMLSPGAMSESCEVFVGRTDTSNAGGIFGLPSEGENILVKVMTFAEAMAMVERDEISNSVTVIALQWLALHHEELRNRWR